MNSKCSLPTSVFLGALAAALYAGSPALAGTFTSDFSNPNQTGFTLNGGFRADGVTPYPAVENGYLALTYNENSQQGSMVLDDLDGGQAIESFVVRFKLQIGPGSGNPADGVSFCFGSEVTSFSNFGEEGIGNGIIVAFDTYDNGGGEAPAVEVKYGGASLAIAKFAKADMVTSKFEAVEIELTRAGMLNVSYKGRRLFENVILPGFQPIAGQFGFGARTGGENANQWIDDLSVTTVVAGGATAPVVTAPPQSQTVNEGAPVTFRINFDGSAPLTFQWLSNNVAIAGATEPTYTIARVPATANGAKYKCTVSNNAGTATSAEATLTVVPDVTPPALVSARGSSDFLGVVVSFSEPVDDVTGGNRANYAIAGLTINAATVFGSNVVLATSKQAEGATYTVVVNNVKDQAAAGNTIAPNSQATFRTFVFMPGFVLHKKYNDFSDATGTSPDNLFADARYPNQPDRMDLLNAVEYPPNGATRLPADPVRNYFDTIEGYFIPPQSGNYVFFTAGADRWWLFLSTDENPANKHLIAAEPGGWTDPRAWNTTHDTDPYRHRSDFSQFNEWPAGATITLTANRRYYLEMVHHDPSWSGGDWFAATYKLEAEDDPADGTAPRLTGNVIGTYVDPSGSEINITQPPADLTEQENRSATFTIVATGTSAYGGSLSYQWQRQAPGSSTWQDLAGATAASYSTSLLTLADSGAKFRVICSVPALVVTSAVATLTVVPDTFAPKIVGAGSIMKGNAIEIGVGFDENVDQSTASAVANYALSKGTVTGVRYQRFAHTDGVGFFQLGTAGPHHGAAVVLTTSGLTAGDNVTVTVKNVKDLKGNAMSAAGESKALVVTRTLKWAAMGGDDYLEGETGGQDITPDPALWPDDVVALGQADFDLISSGTANWNNYDEATFVYEEITGDFDKVVRVEYQDPTSQWARAGMCATPSADEGVNRAAVAGGAMMEKRYLLRVNPAVQWNGAAGNNANEAVWRDTAGGNYSGGGAGIPAYPNAWLRLQRTGQTFTGYYSADGKNWTSYGVHTFTAAEPMPDKLLVGLYYAPELNNNSAGGGIGHSTVAKFRQYGDFKEAGEEPGRTTISLSGGNVTINWEGDGILQSATSVLGPWTNVGSTKPYTAPAAGAAMYFRVQGQ